MLLLAAACTKTADPVFPEAGGVRMQEVDILVGPLATRTIIDRDDEGRELSFAWADGDVISLWARGGTSFSNVLFTHATHPDDPDGLLFRGVVPAMEDGDCRYYAVYPGDRVETAGETVRITLPSEQTGSYDPTLDIMRAEASGAPLQKDRLNRTDLRFRHLTHVLKIRVPVVPFGDGRISGMRVEFPAPVTGTLVFDDITEETPVLEDGANSVTLLFPEPKAAGEEIWVFIAPVDASGAEVRFTATDGTDFSYPAVSTAFRSLEAGHITPVNVGFRLRERVEELFTIAVDKTNLGEDVTVLHRFRLPDGLVFPGLSDPNTAYAGDFTPLGDGKFGIRMFRDVLEEIGKGTADGMQVELEVESEHTVAQPWTSAVTELSTAGLTVSSPYVYFEDFGGVASFPYGDSSTDLSAIVLDDYGLPGWSGARCSADEGNALRISGRTVYSWALFGGSTTRYHGRVDSSPLGRIKEGVTVKVQVSFDYFLGRSNTYFTPRMTYGYHTQPGPIASISGSNDAPGLSDPVESLTSTSSDDGSWTKNYESRSYTIEECTGAHRLAWEIYATGNQSGLTGRTTDGRLYIDNIKVSVAE